MIRAQTNLSGEILVEQTHDRSGQRDEREFALRAAPELHREITALNTDNELFVKELRMTWTSKIPGLPHSTVKAIAECQRSRIDSEDREPPESARSSTRLTTKSII